jgi:hypothetical protein
LHTYESFPPDDNSHPLKCFQFAGVSREDFLASDLTIAASLFNNVFGNSAATKALPALVAISAIGHLLGVAFTVCMYRRFVASFISQTTG